MNRPDLERSITKLMLIRELHGRDLIKDVVVLEIQKEIVRNDFLSDDISLEEVLEALMRKTESNKVSLTSPIKNCTVFICYAHKDNDGSYANKRWLDRLLEHLEPLVLQNQISKWSDKEIETGDFWHEAIQCSLQNAKVAVLLVSPSFLASKYIRNSELPIILKRAKDNGTFILPVVLRPCLFNETKFKYPDPITGPEELSLSDLQAANSPSQPLSGMNEHDQDQIFLHVAQRILKIVHAGGTYI